ncbi:uncharacterized protein LOC130731646 [Lotus japonicus]|uniref:uncharacterized protein LOC130731646 n=1 Tax=Lotus japonicus TaxID=34305 RepID=UPI0025866E28|nr:uncharacterized protein LOC130731646 [Lotus japonicus]
MHMSSFQFSLSICSCLYYVITILLNLNFIFLTGNLVLQLNKNGGCYSDSLKRCNVEMGPADQNIAAKRLQDPNFRQIINGGTSSSNPTNVVDTQISINAGKNLNAPTLGLAIDQTVGGTPNPDAPKVLQLSSTDAATTLKDLQLLNVGTPAPNFISNNVSGTQTAPNASTQPGVIIRDNASEGKRVHEEYKGWSYCPTTNANLESLLKRHREMYSISNSDMQRLLSKFSGPKTNQAPVVTRFDDSNQSLFHKPMAQCAMWSSSLIPRALANLDMNLGGQSFLPSQASGFSGWVNPITPMMTYADLQRRLGVMNPMGPFLMPEEPKSPSELAVGPSSSNQMENVEGRNAEQAQEDEVNGDEELDLDLKL